MTTLATWSVSGTLKQRKLDLTLIAKPVEARVKYGMLSEVGEGMLRGQNVALVYPPGWANHENRKSEFVKHLGITRWYTIT